MNPLELLAMKTNPSYNWEIDVLKFVFAIMIAVFHCSWFRPPSPILSRGYLAVEFFFIVSGFFMAEKLRSSSPPPTGKFILRKIAPIYPVLLGALPVMIAARLIPRHAGIGDWLLSVPKGWMEVFLVQEFGFDVGTFYNGPTWYISAMLISMSVLYPLFAKFPKYFLGVGSLVLALCLYALMLSKFDRLAAGQAWAVIFKFRVVRAFAGISLGVFCNVCAKHAKATFRPTRVGLVVFASLKAILLATVLFLIHAASALGCPTRFDIVIALLEFALVFLVFSGLGDIPWKFPSVSRFLGIASLYVYLNHRAVIWYIHLSKFRLSYGRSMLVFAAGTLCACLLCAALAAIFRRIGRVVPPLLLERRESCGTEDTP